LVFPQRVLLAEPNGTLGARLGDAIGDRAHVDLYPDFPSARRSLVLQPYEWVIANLRLQAYNGLHLLYLARAAGLPAR
jgi:hypothetical protein